jgi:drug/metabolite transporter (DMT)-like permease
MTSINFKEFLGFNKIIAFSGVKEGIAAMMSWGFAFFLIVPVVRSLGWFLPLFLATLFTILFLVVFIIAGKRWTDINRQFFRDSFQFPIIAILLFSGFLNMLAYIGYNVGIIKEYVSIIAPVAASYPLITVILAKIFLKERLVLNQIIGILGTITGLILISL